MKSEKGISLIEELVALAIIGLIAVLFLSTMDATYHGATNTKQMDTARVLAPGQMKYVKRSDYAS
jgi:type II secretory pathway pseudopilin PulG